MSGIEKIIQSLTVQDKVSGDFLDTEEDVLDDIIELVKQMPDTLINDEIRANGIPLDFDDNDNVITKKKQRIEMIEDIMREENLASYIPPTVLHIEAFSENVLDKLLTVEVPTGEYRLTIRKLLKLPLRDLQDQATLLEISTVDKDEIELAREIMKVIKPDSPLNHLLKRRLLKNEMTFAFGIEIELIKDPSRPNSIEKVYFTPHDLFNSEILTKKDIEDECKNQGIPTSKNDQHLKIAMRLISHFQISPDRVRLPFTEKFEEFLLIMSTIKQ